MLETRCSLLGRLTPRPEPKHSAARIHFCPHVVYQTISPTAVKLTMPGDSCAFRCPPRSLKAGAPARHQNAKKSGAGTEQDAQILTNNPRQRSRKDQDEGSNRWTRRRGTPFGE
ncbi:hypothetical protein NDU88_004362 [Pleurodeles waltl]|uniref:Uncharacterized protein n=1 Tax=Pleurodeles waltl TaxID=8319 RepID=A0AAV7T7X2_PLEWA|nr:hypothetical protein NDU88_004362 [Pleurodeles waltl]